MPACPCRRDGCPLDDSAMAAQNAIESRWGSPYFGHDVDVRAYREGTLAIDVFDGKTRQPVWHGWLSKRITEHDVSHAAEQIPPAVAAILGDFPPR